MQDALEKLFAVIEARKTADPEISYVAKMLAKGAAKLAKKVGEEGVEVAIAAA
ncbi:MAG: phosphoribosyl-ATP diphosphatase, partial [Alphaproteobacteria bacterium]